MSKLINTKIITLTITYCFIVIALTACGDDKDKCASGAETSTPLEGAKIAVGNKGYFIGEDFIAEGSGAYYMREINITIGDSGDIIANKSYIVQGFVVSDGAAGSLMAGLNVHQFNSNANELSIDNNGVIFSNVNGQRQDFAIIAMALFENTYQLSELENGIYQENELTGSPAIISPSLTINELLINGQARAIDNTLSLIIDSPFAFLLHDTEGDMEEASSVLLFRNRQGVYVTTDGRPLLVFANSNGNEFIPDNLQIFQSGLYRLPEATTNISLHLGLYSEQDAPVISIFDPAVTASYNYYVNTTVVDDLGDIHDIVFYFIKADGLDEWSLYYIFDDIQIGAPLTINLSNGSCSDAVQLEAFPPLGHDSLPTAAPPYNISLDTCGLYQSASTYQLDDIKRNGNVVLTLNQVRLDECGFVHAVYYDSLFMNDRVSFIDFQVALRQRNSTELGVPCLDDFESISEDIIE